MSTEKKYDPTQSPASELTTLQEDEQLFDGYGIFAFLSRKNTATPTIASSDEGDRSEEKSQDTDDADITDEELTALDKKIAQEKEHILNPQDGQPAEPIKIISPAEQEAIAKQQKQAAKYVAYASSFSTNKTLSHLYNWEDRITKPTKTPTSQAEWTNRLETERSPQGSPSSVGSDSPNFL